MLPSFHFISETQGQCRNGQHGRLWNEGSLHQWLIAWTVLQSCASLWLCRLSSQKCHLQAKPSFCDSRLSALAALAHMLLVCLPQGVPCDSSALCACILHQSMLLAPTAKQKRLCNYVAKLQKHPLQFYWPWSCWSIQWS